MDDDRISSLPNEIICHILSFLPTEDAFTTSFLSKRWTSLWLSVPNLDLDEQRLIETGKPISLIPKLANAIIFTRSLHNPIKSFRLTCHENYDFETLEYDIETWLTAADGSKMEHLDIQLFFICNLPSCIFGLRYLSVLKLKGFSMDTFTSIDFPLLKSLQLIQVHFVERWFLFELLNGCPILEDFEAAHITMPSMESWSYKPDGRVLKCLPKLVKANITNLSKYNFPLEAFCSVESLCLVEMFDKVPVFLNLIHVHIVYNDYIDWHFVLDVLENCPKLQNFEFDLPPYITTNYYFKLTGPCTMPECLSLQLKKCTVKNFRGEGFEMKFVEYIMLNSTPLEKMTICCESSMNFWSKIDLLLDLLYLKGSAACQLYLK